jgi:hypothetical protein
MLTPATFEAVLQKYKGREQEIFDMIRIKKSYGIVSEAQQARTALRQYAAQYDQSMLTPATFEAVLQKYKGREQELFEIIRKLKAESQPKFKQEETKPGGNGAQRPAPKQTNNPSLSLHEQARTALRQYAAQYDQAMLTPATFEAVLQKYKGREQELFEIIRKKTESTQPEEEQARREAEHRARTDAEEEARREAGAALEEAKQEAEEKHWRRRAALEEDAKQAAEEKAKQEAEEAELYKAWQVKQEEDKKVQAEEQARKEAEEEEKSRKEAEEQARKEAEEQARKEAEEQARKEAEEQARKAEEQARKEAEEQARKEAEEQARKEAEEQARKEAEEQARKAEAKQQAEMSAMKQQLDQMKLELESAKVAAKPVAAPPVSSTSTWSCPQCTLTINSSTSTCHVCGFAKNNTGSPPQRMLGQHEEAINILPSTRWEDVVPTRSCSEELRQNPGIRAKVLIVDSVADDVDVKVMELPYVDPPLPVELPENELYAIVAYTHDSGSGRESNLYYQLNAQLRQRGAAERQAMVHSWGTFVHFALKVVV